VVIEVGPAPAPGPGSGTRPGRCGPTDAALEPPVDRGRRLSDGSQPSKRQGPVPGRRLRRV